MPQPVRFENERFLKAFRERVARSKSALPVVVNRAAYQVAKEAVDEVERADRTKIEALGVAAYRVLTKATKNNPARFLKKAKIVYGNAAQIRMGAIYAAKLREKGINPKNILPDDFQRAVQRALAGRLKSIGFVASGLVPVLKKLAARIGVPAYRPAQAQQSGTPKGDATPAVAGWKCSASFEVSSGLNVKSPESRARVRGNLEKAISLGYSKTADEWEKYAAEELNKVWKS